MNKGAAVFLRTVLVLFGLGILALMLWEPHLEGRNANATVSQIYFGDPFLAYLYVASIAFFIGLYQAYKVLGYAGEGTLFSAPAVKAVRTIKHCAMAMIAFVIGAEIFILMQTGEDRAGGVMMGLFIALICTVIATAMALLEKNLHSAAQMKSEHDLTV